jgi:hypothetical protein
MKKPDNYPTREQIIERLDTPAFNKWCEVLEAIYYTLKWETAVTNNKPPTAQEIKSIFYSSVDVALNESYETDDWNNISCGTCGLCLEINLYEDGSWGVFPSFKYDGPPVESEPHLDQILKDMDE